MKNSLKKIFAWSVLTLIILATLSPIQMRPGDIFSVDLDRALAFGLLSGLFMIAYPRLALIVGVFVVLSAGLIESLQLLSPTRHARLDDALVKAGGAVVGMCIALIHNSLCSAKGYRAPSSPLVTNQAMQLLQQLDGEATALPLASKIIKEIYFSPSDGRLRIRMRNGEERLFVGIPNDTVQALISAPSPGRYYVEEIRERFQRLAA
jgi:VanZ family protein